MEINIGQSQMKISDDPDDLIVTYSLGSCIGVSIYDENVKIGGLLHFQLPDSNESPTHHGKTRLSFADTAIPALLEEVCNRGAEKERLKVVIAGGSEIMFSGGSFDVGKRNIIAARKILFENNIHAKYIDVGGNDYRTMRLYIRTGSTHIITPNCKTEVS